MTAFADIHNAIVDVLRAAPAVADGEVMKTRLRPLSMSTTRAVVVRLDQRSEAFERVLGALDWVTVFAIECYARSGPGKDAEDVADALLSEVFKRLLSAPLVGQHGITSAALQPALDWQLDMTGDQLSCCTLSFAVTHRTPIHTLDAWN